MELGTFLNEGGSRWRSAIPVELHVPECARTIDRHLSHTDSKTFVPKRWLQQCCSSQEPVRGTQYVLSQRRLAHSFGWHCFRRPRRYAGRQATTQLVRQLVPVAVVHCLVAACLLSLLFLLCCALEHEQYRFFHPFCSHNAS